MILADSNVLLDVIEDDPRGFSWSSRHLDAAPASGLVVNSVICAEIAPAFHNVAALKAFIAQSGIEVTDLTPAASFEAGQAHARYRDRGGERERVLSDFLIGAQALTMRCAILTRDPRRYRTSFPDVRLITP